MCVCLINFDFKLCNANFDFILYYNLSVCFTQLETHVRLICAIKFYLLTYLMFTLVPAHSGSAGQRAIKQLCMCVPMLTNLLSRNIASTRCIAGNVINQTDNN